MKYLISATAVLLIFWLTLSGIYTTFLVTMGVLSSVVIALLAAKMNVVDDEGHPVHLALPALTYWPWLVWQIVLSAINVTKIILNPNLPVSPTMTRVKMAQQSDVGRVTYANSITLTPGTISVDIEDDDIIVHAVTRENAIELEGGEMNQRVAKFEGSA